jgi:hypothetical protein
MRDGIVACGVVNIFLVSLWAATGMGYFWPGWVLAGCAVLLLLRAWKVSYRQSIMDAAIEEELSSGR